jgi:hypothetical protein
MQEILQRQQKIDQQQQQQQDHQNNPQAVIGRNGPAFAQTPDKQGLSSIPELELQAN